MAETSNVKNGIGPANSYFGLDPETCKPLDGTHEKPAVEARLDAAEHIARSTGDRLAVMRSLEDVSTINPHRRQCLGLLGKNYFGITQKSAPTPKEYGEMLNSLSEAAKAGALGSIVDTLDRAREMRGQLAGMGVEEPPAEAPLYKKALGHLEKFLRKGSAKEPAFAALFIRDFLNRVSHSKNPPPKDISDGAISIAKRVYADVAKVEHSMSPDLINRMIARATEKPKEEPVDD